MDPLTIALLALGGGTALGGLFKGWGQDPYQKLGSPDDMVMVNQDQVNQFLAMLGQQQSGAQRLAGTYGNRSAGALDSIASLTGNYANLQRSLQGLLPQYEGISQGIGGTLGQINQVAGSQDPSKALNLFLGKMPELKDVVASLTASATGGTPDALKQQAAAMGAQAKTDISSQLAGGGLLNSGAGIRALAEGVATPTMNANVEMQKQYGNTYQGLANLLLGGGMESLNQGVRDSAQNQIGALQAALQGQSLQGSLLGQRASGLEALANMVGQQQAGLGQVASGYGSLAGSQMSLLNNLLALQGQMNEPVYWQPSYVQNPDYVSAGDLLGIGTSLIGLGASRDLGTGSGSGAQAVNPTQFSGSLLSPDRRAALATGSPYGSPRFPYPGNMNNVGGWLNEDAFYGLR